MKKVRILSLFLAIVIACTGCSGNNVNTETVSSGESVESGDYSTTEIVSEAGGVSSSGESTSSEESGLPDESELSEESVSAGESGSFDESESPVETENTDFVSTAESEEPEKPDVSVSMDDTGHSDSVTENETIQLSANDSKFTFSWKGGNTWQEGGKYCGTLELTIKNNSGKSIDGWKASFSVPKGFSISNAWNGTITVKDTTATAVNANYNSLIMAGGTATVGFNYSSPSVFNPPEKVTFNGTVAKETSGSNSSANGSGGNNSSGNNGSSSGNGSSGNTSSATTTDVNKLLKRSSKAVQGDDWLHTDGNKILDKNGKQVWLTGVNWFGYNTGTNTFDGLWNSELVASVKSIADHGFNLIRVPISAELINQWAAGVYPKANYNTALNPELNNMNSLQIFDYFLVLAEQNGIKVMPDIHCAETNAMGHNVNLWYTDKVSVDDYYHALEWIAERYKNNDTIIAIDLKNEPHGKQNEDNKAIWNDSKSKNNWKYTAETAAKKVLAKNPNLLIMVEGTEIYPKSKSNSDYKSTNEKDYYFNWWGGNLRGVKDYPINLGKYQDKLVYSPHDYGPTVYEQPWFKGSYDYNSLIKDCWQDNWLYIHKNNTAPLLIGEWGGYMKEPNLKWMTCMRKLIKTYHLNHTFWCFNANSGDTGGLVLDDFKTWDEEKYNFVKEVLWQENGKFVGLDHAIPLGTNGITTKAAKGL